MAFDTEKKTGGTHRVLYAMRSRAGGQERNEDAVRMEEKGGEYLFALADGQGGRGKGDEASRIALRQACALFRQTAPHAPCLREAFRSAQNCIRTVKAQRGIFSVMKTTMVLLWIDRREAEWAHVGDSRLYAFVGSHLSARTLDHSVAQSLAQSGEITEDGIRHHPDRKYVLRTLGGEDDDGSCDVSGRQALEGRRAFLLCSDGFWEWIDEQEMEETLRRSASPAQWLNEMEKIVQKNGTKETRDDYSAITVWVLEG